MLPHYKPALCSALPSPSTLLSHRPQPVANMPSSEKRQFSGANITPNAKASHTHNTSAGQKIKNFFRITSINKNDVAHHPAASDASSQKDALQHDGTGTGVRTPQSQHNKSSLRNSRFLPHIGRSRSTTVASEGNQLDDGMSPTAHANPYFQHQGLPNLRHHDAGSVPPSPPDTPRTPKLAPEGGSPQDAVAAKGKEELARKLRRVASAPNAQGLFTKPKGASSDSRPTTAETESLPKLNGVGTHNNVSALSMVETVPPGEALLPVPGLNGLSPGKIRNSVAFRRTYSSNSIKVRNVEVGPGSFDKIKMIGKGDVGKVYLVREKKSARLFAMKGE